MKRNYGIDALRIVAMFMVTVLHVLGQGGIIAAAEPQSTHYWIAWFFEIACYSCTNCFALISGYVLYKSDFKLSRPLELWLQTAFYTVGAAAAFLVLIPGAVGGKALIHSLFPFSSGQYWYISSYFGVLILMPLLNNALRNMGEKEMGILLSSVFVLFCAVPVVIRAEPYGLMGGYSVIWLCLLYLAGGYIHKYHIAEKIKTWIAWVVVIGMIAVTFLTKFVIEQFLQGVPIVSLFKNAFISFTSPTMILISIGLLVLFSKYKPGPIATKCIGLLSPVVLGVYLLHVNPLVWKHFIKGFSENYVNYNCLVTVGLILLAAVVIFAAGIVIEYFRVLLFKLTRLDRLSPWLSKKLSGIYPKVLQ